MEQIINQNPWKLFQKAIKQANSWTPAKREQKFLFSELIDFCIRFKNDLNNHLLEVSIITLANALSLQVKRIKKEDDDFLMFYTNENVTDYNGPFLMFRISQSDKIVIISPHNESDGTSIDTVIGFTETKAMWYICNGHKRAVNQPERNTTDFIRNNQSLGFHVVRLICEKFKGSIVYHIHGSKRPGVCLVKSRSKQLESIFKESIKDNTNIETFKAFNAGYVLDSIVNTNMYLKTEIPTKTHLSNKKIIKEIVIDAQKKIML